VSLSKTQRRALRYAFQPLKLCDIVFQQVAKHFCGIPPESKGKISQGLLTFVGNVDKCAVLAKLVVVAFVEAVTKSEPVLILNK